MHIYPYEQNPLLKIAVSCITVAHCNQEDTLLIAVDNKVVKQLDMTDFIFEPDVSPEAVIRLLHGMAVKYSNESGKTSTTESVFVPSTNLKS